MLTSEKSFCGPHGAVKDKTSRAQFYWSPVSASGGGEASVKTGDTPGLGLVTSGSAPASDELVQSEDGGRRKQRGQHENQDQTDTDVQLWPT